MQLALLELHQVRQHVRGQRITLPNKLRQSRHELRIPDSHQSILVAHESSLPCVILSFALLHRDRFQPQNGSQFIRALESPTTQNLAQTKPQIQLTLHDHPPNCPKPVYKNRHPNRRITPRANRTSDARISVRVVSHTEPRMRESLVRPHASRQGALLEPTLPRRRSKKTHDRDATSRPISPLRLAEWSRAPSLPHEVSRLPRQRRPLRRHRQNRHPFLHRLALAGIERPADARADQRLDSRFRQFEDERTTYQHRENLAVHLQRVRTEHTPAGLGGLNARVALRQGFYEFLKGLLSIGLYRHRRCLAKCRPRRRRLSALRRRA